MDPGISFHPVCITSHTRNAWPVITANSMTKNTITPEGEGLVSRGKGVGGRIATHRRIFLCRCQGVIRIAVKTIEILAPLLKDKPNVPGGGEKGLTRSGYKSRRWRGYNR